MVSEESSKKFAVSLVKKLLQNYSSFFDKKNAVLNSDGRRILNDIIRECLKIFPEKHELCKNARREPTLKNIRKLAELFLPPSDVDELIHEGVSASWIRKRKIRRKK